MDIKKAKESNNIVEVVGRFVTLTQKGHNHKGCCPFHNESTPSFTVSENLQRYKCFGCGATGDVIDFVTRINNWDVKQAYDYLIGEGVSATPVYSFEERAKNNSNDWQPVLPIPEGIKTPSFNHKFYGKPSKVWTYTDIDGRTLGYISRFDTEEGKQILPLTYCRKPDGAEQWRNKAFPTPRPLYNLAALKDKPNARIILVEGEKAADAGQSLIPTSVWLSWPGGSKAVKYADFSVLKDRYVYLWPDKDKPGFDAMFEIAEILEKIGCKVQWITPPPKAPKGWDIADTRWNSEQAKQYAKNNTGPVPPKDTLPVFEQEVKKEPVAVAKQEPQPEQEQDSKLPPFVALGWDKNEAGKANYHFYVYSKKTVLSFSSSSLSLTSLMELAPISYWEMNFKGKKGVDLPAAQNYLINISNQKGPFSPSIRGRGAWLDKNRVVIHNGPYLLVDGKKEELHQFKSKHIYENSPNLGFQLSKPLAANEASVLIKLVRLLDWERSINALLLIGWCAVAPICGALNWRPHIWLTGPAGSGKSWVFLNIVRRLLGDTCLAVQGDSTEAGLRQTLGHDAIPVVFDEAEQYEDERGSGRIQNVLSLMRTASADDGGVLVKGSANGNARSFKIRSCFAYASVIVQVKNQADRSRVTILSLNGGPQTEERKENFKKIVEIHNKSITDDFVLGFRSRIVGMMPTILKNIPVFTAAATEVLGVQRAGDQLGVLLAGAYAVWSDGVITYENALEIVKKHNWDEEKGTDTLMDEMSLLNTIIETVEIVDKNGVKITRSIGELIKIAAGYGTDDLFSRSYASESLNRFGIRIDDDDRYFIVANSHSWIKKILQRTAFANNHHKILQRIKGAMPSDKPVRFGAGGQHRAVFVPISILFDEKI